MSKLLRERSPLVYVLVGLIPYSKPNLLLTYKPGLFFRELEKASRYKRATLESAYRSAQKQKLIERHDNVIRLTDRGRRKVAPFTAKELHGQASLMIIFDIPEDDINTRRKFRTVLKEWQCKQIQKSVWMTGKDLIEEIVEVVKEMGLSDYVQIYECARRFPK